MPYIAKKPGTAFRTFTDKDLFSGDGSTTIFDMQFAIAEAGQNDLQVFVGTTRQMPGTDYTLGTDSSGDYKRITFTSAPAAGTNNITVLNPGTVQGEFSSVADNAVTNSKLNTTAITGQTELAEAPADTDTFLVHDASAGAIKKIANSNLVGSALITGKDEITIGNVASDDVLLIFDTSAGVLKKITKSAFDALQPAFSSVTPSNLLTGDGTGNFTIVVAGSDFDNAATFKLVTDGGTDINLDSVSRDSGTQLTGTVAKNKANLTNANEPFDIVITNGNGLSATASNALNIDAQPAWVTSSGSLSTLLNANRSGVSITVTATDPDSGAINYAITTGALPGGLSLNTSTGVISGDADAVANNTTFNFTIEARDTASNATERDFSIAVQAPVIQSFTSSGTFSVPSGLTAVDVLVVGGGGAGGIHHAGGGGAGGLIYRPAFPVTPGGSVSVTVGSGGGPEPSPGPTPHGGTRGDTGQDSVFGTLTAKGGGGGGSSGPEPPSGFSGGSGGGRSGPGSGSGGQGLQPNQPGDSGNYGFGNPGGNGSGAGGAGGGGAAAAGGNAGASGGAGGNGKSYTIADGTSSVFYAGGGGGGVYQNPSGPGPGGQGGGGRGSATGPDGNTNVVTCTDGTANRGGGGGGSDRSTPSGAGGKGIVIVSY